MSTDARHAPDHRAELGMSRAAVRVGAALALPAFGIATAVRGLDGGLTALGAVALVTTTFVVTGRSLHWAAERSLVLLQAVALGGFFLRLVAYAAAIVLLRPVDAIDGPVLAITAATAIVVLLVAEVRLVTSRAEWWWLLDPTTPATTARAAAAPSADPEERA